MSGLHPIPWPGLAIALTGCVALVLAGAPAAMVILIAISWAGSLWIARTFPERPPPADTDSAPQAQRMGELIEGAGTPLLLTDRNRIVVANQATRRVLGEHVVGQDVRVALRHPDALALIDEGDGATLVRGLARRKDIWRVSRKALSDGLAVIELLNRTSEEDVGRAHTDFVANASHELRTPLSSIIGYVETLDEALEGDGAGVELATTRRFYGIILREARRLQAMVSDLISLSRIEAEKHDQPARPVALGPLMRRAACDAAGPERLGRLDFALEADDAVIAGDDKQLEQLVRNLVDNALKYGGPGKVTVGLAKADDDRVLLMVTDRGEGIDPVHLPHLTRRFYRTDPGRSRASGGTGLGLAIVKHIVERHRGRLDIESQVGEGTRVSVRFRRAENASGKLSGADVINPPHMSNSPLAASPRADAQA